MNAEHRMRKVCRSLNRHWVAACITFVGALAAQAEIKPAPIFADHMVLQRGMPVPVWGTAAPGEKVVVKFRDQEKTVQAAADGHWQVKLDPMKEGGPDVLQIGECKIADVLVGEVWLGAGQSNMVIGTPGMAKNDPVLASLATNDYPQIRIGWGNKGDWRVLKAPVGVGALPFAFSVNLWKQLNVPVGVVLGAVPGSSTDFWLTPEAVKADAECRAAIETYATTVYPAEKKHYEDAMKKWEAQDPAKRPANKPEPPLEPGGARHEIGKFFREYIQPVVPFAVRGVLWDQGENGPSITGTKPLMVTRALITSWRKEWGRDEMPWVYVQKPSGGGCAWDPQNSVNRLADTFEPLPDTIPNGGSGRHQYVSLLQVTNTFMVITSDLSPGVHPPNKSGYGERAAEVAMVAAYGKKAEIYGPLYAGCKVEGERVRIRFTHVGQGLAIKPADKLQGFSVAGEDRRFVWAEAAIDGDTVVVSSPKVHAPVAVRYAYSDKCPWANLFNKDGLPAPTFRTDSWERQPQ